MTSTNVNPIESSISQFKKLNVNDRLGILALIYRQVADSIPSEKILASHQDEVQPMLVYIEQLNGEEQLNAFSEILAEEPDVAAMGLDVGNTIEVVERSPISTTYPTDNYPSLDMEAKIAFWVAIAEKMGDTVVAIPEDYQPSSTEANQILDSVKSMSSEDLMFFLQKTI